MGEEAEAVVNRTRDSSRQEVNLQQRKKKSNPPHSTLQKQKCCLPARLLVDVPAQCQEEEEEVGPSHLDRVNSAWPRLIGRRTGALPASPTEGKEKKSGKGGRRRGRKEKNGVIKLWVMSGSHGWHPPHPPLSHTHTLSLLSPCRSPPPSALIPLSPSFNPSSHFLFHSSVALPPLFFQEPSFLPCFFFVCCHSFFFFFYFTPLCPLTHNSRWLSPILLSCSGHAQTLGSFHHWTHPKTSHSFIHSSFFFQIWNHLLLLFFPLTIWELIHMYVLALGDGSILNWNQIFQSRRYWKTKNKTENLIFLLWCCCVVRGEATVVLVPPCKASQNSEAKSAG